MSRDIQQVMKDARDGSPLDFVTLAKTWTSYPDPLRRTIFSIFLNYLVSSQVLIDPSMDTLSDMALDQQPPVASPYFRAYWSLYAITQMDSQANNFSLLNLYAQGIIYAWPGIFKWGVSLFTSRVQSQTPGSDTADNIDPSTFFVRAATRDIIANSWLSVAYSEAVRKVMMETQGFVSTVLGLWVHEAHYKVEGWKRIQAGERTWMRYYITPVPSTLLQALMEYNNDHLFPRLLLVMTPEQLAKIATNRLEDSLKASELDCAQTNIHLWLCSEFTRASESQVCEAIMNQGAGILCTKLLVRVASCIGEHAERSEEYKRLLVYGFKCIIRFVHVSNGVPWVIQVVKAGILSAFVEASPVFDSLKEEDYLTCASFILLILPSYLCYRSVIDTVDTALQKHGRTERFYSIKLTRAWEDITDLTQLAAKRKALFTHLVKISKDNYFVCSNYECKTVDDIKKFRKCSNCLQAFYCSEECQTIHWNEGQHKLYCMERRTFNSEFVTYREWDYLMHLGLWEARMNMPSLKVLAGEKYPNTPRHDLVIYIDYTHGPPQHTVLLRSEVDQEDPDFLSAPGDLLRNGTEIKTVILALLPCGKRKMYYIHQYHVDFWEGDSYEPPPKLDPTGTKFIDNVQEFGLSEWRKYWGIDSDENVG